MSFKFEQKGRLSKRLKKISDQPVLSVGTVISGIDDNKKIVKLTDWSRTKFHVSDGEKWVPIEGWASMSNWRYPFFVRDLGSGCARLYIQEQEDTQSDLAIIVPNYGSKRVIQDNSDSSYVYSPLRDFTYLKRYEGLDRVEGEDNSVLLFQLTPTRYLYVDTDDTTYEFSLMTKNEQVVQLYTRMGNNAVPYPVLLTNLRVYLMLSKAYMDLTELDRLSVEDRGRVLANIDDEPYPLYYSTKNRPMMVEQMPTPVADDELTSGVEFEDVQMDVPLVFRKMSVNYVVEGMAERMVEEERVVAENIRRMNERGQ